MPATVASKPQTSRQAKRAYQRSNKRYEFTATQHRKAERLDLLEQRANKAKEKEQRTKDNKRKREDKEEKEREIKRRLVADGKIQPESLWGKVGASQPRLNNFLISTTTAKQVSADGQVVEESDKIQTGSVQLATADNMMQQAQQTVELSNEELLEFFLSPVADAQIDNAVSNRTELIRKAQDRFTLSPLQPAIPVSDPEIDPDQALLDAQLSLSGSMEDFVIAEDDSADHADVQPEVPSQRTPSHQRHLSASILAHTPATPSPLKRKRSDPDMATPSKSARSVLSEMSSLKVNVRAQEKPDPASMALMVKSSSNLQQNGETASQVANETLAMISTQDLTDDEYTTNKENENPSNSKTLAEDEKGVFSNSYEKSGSKPTPLSEKMRKSRYSEDYDDCEDLFDSDETLEDFDAEISDEFFAGLSTQMPAKSTLVTAQGSPRKAKDQLTLFNTNTPIPPPECKPKLLEVQLASEKSTAASRSVFKKVESFAFDDVDDADLAKFAEGLERSSLSKLLHKGRLIPWQQHPAPSSASEPLTAAPTPSPEEFPDRE